MNLMSTIFNHKLISPTGMSWTVGFNSTSKMHKRAIMYLTNAKKINKYFVAGSYIHIAHDPENA